jgi:hypothetical protein
MANAHQTLGQNVFQMTPDKLLAVSRQPSAVSRQPSAVSRQPSAVSRHGLTITVAIIFIREVHRLHVNRYQLLVADGNAMGIAHQIVDDRVFVEQTRFGIDHPLACHQLGEQLVDFTRPSNAVEQATLGGLSCEVGAPNFTS